MLPVAFGPLGLTLKEFGRLTPYEAVNLYHGFLWRKERAEETIAGLVTLWIANMARKANKRPLKMTDIFRDGRFGKKECMNEFLEDFDGG
jgi:hypothetical protein